MNDFVSKSVVTQNTFSSLVQSIMIKIDCCFSILFSNLKQKKNTTLLLVELFVVTWVPCLLRHPVYKNK